jgi:hypothetical protein
MDDPRRTGADDDADIDLDTQELVPPASPGASWLWAWRMGVQPGPISTTA